MIVKYIELINILGEKYQIVNVLNRMILDYLNNYTSPFKNNTLLIKYDNNIKILQSRSRSGNSRTYNFGYNSDIIKKDKIVDITFKFTQNLKKDTHKLSLVAKQIRLK